MAEYGIVAFLSWEGPGRGTMMMVVGVAGERRREWTPFWAVDGACLVRRVVGRLDVLSIADHDHRQCCVVQ